MSYFSSIAQRVIPFFLSKCRQGQTIVEFLLLLLVLMLMSWMLIYGFKDSVMGFWRAFIIIVSTPSEDIPNINF